MRKRTIRRHYELVNTVVFALEGASLISEEKKNKLRFRELAAIEAFVRGKATVQEWHDINSMLSVTETMAKDGFGPEALPTCQSAQGHLIDAARRFEATGKMGLTGPGIQAMRDLYEYHDLQRSSVCLRVYENFIQKAIDRIRSNSPDVVHI